MGLPFSAIVKYVMGGFNPLSWFAKGEPGAWYDPSDLTTLFQDSAGATPVTAVEQPVGLMLDKSRGLALGAELVTNGGPFTNTTGWQNTSGTLSVSEGLLNATNTVSGYIFGSWGLNLQYYYEIKIIITAITGRYRAQQFGGAGSVGEWITSPGTYTIRFYNSTANSNCGLNTDQASTISISSFSVKQISGNHAFQATAGNRPLLSARVNLLTKTEDFSDAVWTTVRVGAAPAISPDGALSASKIAAGITLSAPYQFYQLGKTVVATPFTWSVYAKAAELNWLVINAFDGTNRLNYFNLSTGLPGATSAGATSSMSPIGNGWYKCSVINTPSAGANSGISIELTTGDGVVSPLLSTGQGIYIWHPDLRPTNAGALLPPYQRVNTASDYDTVGFPLYLKANGTSSAMSTNSIDFTGTDKMTVVTGVRKLSALSELILELSADVSASTGSFYLGTTAPNIINSGSKGTVVANVVAPATYPSPVSFIDTFQSVISQPLVNLRLNSVQVATVSASQGSGNFGNYPLYLFARGGTLYPFTGQFYGAIIRGAASDTASVTQTENYMAQKTGITF